MRLSVRVPRGAAGDVEGGVREVVEGVVGVRRVEVDRLRGVHPEALDLRVDADVVVTLDTEVAEALAADAVVDHDAGSSGVGDHAECVVDVAECDDGVAEHLRDGFGVLEAVVD